MGAMLFGYARWSFVIYFILLLVQKKKALAVRLQS